MSCFFLIIHVSFYTDWRQNWIKIGLGTEKIIKLKTCKITDLNFIIFQHLSYFFTYDPNMHRRTLSAVTWLNILLVDVKMES